MSVKRDGSQETIAVRLGDSIDAVALRDWLHLANGAICGARDALRITQFPGGFSNLTYLIQVDGSGASRDYVLRRPPHGVKAGSAHDMHREFALLSALHPTGVPVPKPIVYCDEVKIIGTPFYVMERVDGVILRATNALELKVDVPTFARLSQTFIATLAQLHCVDATTPALASMGKPNGYAARQVQGWSKRWSASRTGDLPTMDSVAAWLDANTPPQSDATLVHNDFKYDNIVLDRADFARVVAILDWEMATIGDPLMDLGTSLAYWVEADDPPVFRSLGLGATSLPGNATRADLVAMYAKATGRNVSNVHFYHAFGLFKVAVIAQQIYARHVQGLTSDPRFGALNVAVNALAQSAADTISSGHV